MSISLFPLVNLRSGEVNLTAAWITPPGEKFDNFTFLARKEFIVDDIPERAVLHICADSKYCLYLNGKRVGNGPARGTDIRFFFDSYDVTKGLRTGNNVIAARVHCAVKALTSAVPPIAPALFVQLESLVQTDSSWQVCVDPSYRADALMYTHHIGYSEFRDLRKELVDWQTCDDQHDGWTAAELVSDTPTLKDRVLTPRDIPALTDTRYRPKQLVKTAAVPFHHPDSLDDREYAALMQNEMHLETQGDLFVNVEALLRGEPAQVLPGSRLKTLNAGEGSLVILDFGRELCGNLILDVEGPAGTVLDVGYDEAVDRDRLDTLRINPMSPTQYRFADRYILRQGRQRIDSRLHDRGMRMLQLVFRSFTEPVTIHAAEMADRIYPIPVDGHFNCDQPFWNRLWDMCIATMNACCTDLFLDCPWREQTFWLDDHYEENQFYLNMSADRAFPTRNLRIAAEGAMPNGQIPGRYPAVRNCLLPCTSANWVMSLWDYYFYTADLDLVRELLPAAEKIVDLYHSWRDDDHLVPDQEGEYVWNFIDWGYDSNGVKLGGKTAPLNMLVATAFKLTGLMHQAAGNESRGQTLGQWSAETATAMERHLWVENDRHFRDCTAPKDGRETFSQIPHALGLCYDLLASPVKQAAPEVLLNPEAVRAEFGYLLFVLDALSRNGRADQALHAIHRFWGHMVSSDSPTLWEVVEGRSSMGGCGSLCHAFSCAPMHFAQTTLLGVRPSKPGFAEFTFAPQSLGLLWAEGDVPTPHGPIHVRWALQDDGELLADLQVPEGTTALCDGQHLTAGTHRISHAKAIRY